MKSLGTLWTMFACIFRMSIKLLNYLPSLLYCYFTEFLHFWSYQLVYREEFENDFPVNSHDQLAFDRGFSKNPLYLFWDADGQAG